MYLAPLNYDRFFKKVFSHTHIAKAFLEDFFEKKIEEIEQLETSHFLTHDSTKVSFDFRCKIEGQYIIIDMQQWYKSDVVKRFYLYHCASTVLQLELLPQKKIISANPNEKRAKSIDYQEVVPVLTIIWMVNDNMGFKENLISYINAPDEVTHFVRDENIWNRKNIDELVEKRTYLAGLINNKKRDLEFLQENKLVFMFQPNIIKSDKIHKYYRWFEFAEKTRNSENEKEDFEAYKDDETFREIMYLILKDSLAADDFAYIESEEENIELFERTFRGWKKEGLKEGREEGIKEGEAKKEQELVLNMHNKGYDSATIADLLSLNVEKINQIIGK